MKEAKIFAHRMARELKSGELQRVSGGLVTGAEYSTERFSGVDIERDFGDRESPYGN